MTFNIYNLDKYEIFLDDDHNPINCGIFNGDIDSIVTELKFNNKGYHLQLKPDKLYTVFGDLDDVKSEDEFKNICYYLCENLDIQLHAISYTQSIKNNKFSYHFSIPLLHTSLGIMKKLFKMFKDDEPEILNALDLNVYSPYRWFRLPGQTLDIKPLMHNIEYGEMKDFILPYIHPDSNPLTFDTNNTNNNKIDDQIFKSIDKPLKKLFKYDSSIKFKITDEQIADLLDQLPYEYIEDYDKWSIITNILKGLDKKDLWNKWSYQSDRYNQTKNNTIWRNIKKIKFDINYTVNVINQN